MLRRAARMHLAPASPDTDGGRQRKQTEEDAGDLQPQHPGKLDEWPPHRLPESRASFAYTRRLRRRGSPYLRHLPRRSRSGPTLRSNGCLNLGPDRTRACPSRTGCRCRRTRIRSRRRIRRLHQRAGRLPSPSPQRSAEPNTIHPQSLIRAPHRPRNLNQKACIQTEKATPHYGSRT